MADLPATEAIRRFAQSQGALLTTFIAAIFLSAALLFLVEPMFTKMVLPRLGGSPSVVFLQSRRISSRLGSGTSSTNIPRWTCGW